MGYAKSPVYAEDPQTFNDLEELKIRRDIAGIRTQVLAKLFENRTSRMRFLIFIKAKKWVSPKLS